MFSHYRNRGIILKEEKRGEADLLFTIYTRDFGKVEVLGKSIRKISSKLRAGMGLFHLSEIEFIQGKAYKTLTDAILIDKFGGLRTDLARLRIAYKIAESLDDLVKGQEQDENIWRLLLEIFTRLNTDNLKPKSCRLVYYYFLWNLFSLLGYRPELQDCVLCQEKLLPDNLYFSPKEGGIVCQNCREKTKNGLNVSPEVLKILRIVLDKKWETLVKIKKEDIYLESISRISKEYYSYILNNL